MRLWKSGDNVDHLALIAKIARVLDAYMADRPLYAAEVLRRWYRSAPGPAERAIIAACAPREGEQRRRTPSDADRTPQWNRKNKHEAPRDVRTERRADARRRRRSRDEQNAAAVAANYQEVRAGIAEGAQILDRDDRTRAEQVYASGFDYDRAALYRTSVEMPCLWAGCRRLRERNDLDAERVKAGHGDDGLCRECREDDRPGIAPLPVGHTMRDAIHARCAFIFDEQNGALAGLLALRSAYKESRNANTQALIAEWVATNLPDEDDPAELAKCTWCGERPAREDGACTDELCREAAAELAAEEEAAAEKEKRARYRLHLVKPKRTTKGKAATKPKRTTKGKADARTKRPANR